MQRHQSAQSQTICTSWWSLSQQLIYIVCKARWDYERNKINSHPLDGVHYIVFDSVASQWLTHSMLETHCYSFALRDQQAKAWGRRRLYGSKSPASKGWWVSLVTEKRVHKNEGEANNICLEQVEKPKIIVLCMWQHSTTTSQVPLCPWK